MIQSLLLLLPLLLSRAPSQPITFPTEPPVLLGDGYGYLDLLPEKELRVALKGRLGEPDFVPLSKDPSGLSGKALFDLVLVLEQTVTLAVDRDADGGYSLFVDLDADGRLDDEQAWPMPRGTFTLLDEPRDAFIGEIRTILKRNLDGKEIELPFAMKVAFTGNTVQLPGRAPRWEALYTESVLRTGVATLPGLTVRFGLRGEGGIYDYDYAAVVFDTDGNGAMDPGINDRMSSEFFWVWEKTVNLGGRSYAFSVDHCGRSLTLTPVKKAPERADLRPGHPAPDFTFRDLAGKKHRLADYRGKVVLLDFWGTWCPACVVHAGDLVRAYEELRPRGFEILGVHMGGTAKEVEEFLSRYHLTWPQTLESTESSAGRPLQRLYRVFGAPVYFLVGERGEIILSGERQPSVVTRAARERLRRP